MNSMVSSVSNNVWSLLISSSAPNAWPLNSSGARVAVKHHLRPGLKCMSRSLSPSELAAVSTADISMDSGHHQGNKFHNEVLTSSADTEQLVKYQIENVRKMLSSMEDGEISVSAYDTAWVALIENIGKPGVPQFPSSLDWITMNQLDDGSWGDKSAFLAHDRILGTLACVVALKKWNIHPEKIQKGFKFIMGNMGKLKSEDDQHVPAGFELIVPTLLEMAKELGMAEAADIPWIQNIYALRDLKRARIPMEVVHHHPTTLLFSLEGIREGLDWTKLLKLRCEDGSFLFSLSSTAFAAMQTKDEKCLNYLQNVVEKFQKGVPCYYPISIFERLWAVDKVERLGISRHFQKEIKDCLSYVHGFWNDKGLCWEEPSPVKDLDDTVMGFRLLRLYGFEVSPDVIRNFKKGDEFLCFEGQMLEGPTVMLNLYRASQVQFPGETILKEAKKYSFDFLRAKQAGGEIFDKWMILKDLPGEIEYALDIPWHASLPRLEARIFIDQYGGENDACIAKCVHRLPKMANNTYLELAKLDYNNCQAIHQQEFNAFEMSKIGINRWYEDNKILKDVGISKRDLLVSYYLSAASIFEPERFVERLAWAKSSILVESIISYLVAEKNNNDKCQKSNFLNEFLSKVLLINGATASTNTWIPSGAREELVFSLISFLHDLSMDFQVVNRSGAFALLSQAWMKWLLSVDYKAEMGGYSFGDEAELLVQTINICTMETCRGSETLSSISFDDDNYAELSLVTNKLCTQLRQLRNKQCMENGNLETGKNGGGKISSETECMMQQVVQLVYTKSHDTIKKASFMAVARSFYYMAYFEQVTVDEHIAKVLFTPVE